MVTNVISFSEKKKIKERENNNKLTMPIYDFYIPFDEIPFWTYVGNYMQQMDWQQMIKTYQTEVGEFVTAFTLDIEMYREFGDTLEKFRFLFNHLEIHFLHKVLLEIKHSEFDGLLKHYRVFLARLMKDNEKLSKLI